MESSSEARGLHGSLPQGRGHLGKQVGARPQEAHAAPGKSPLADPRPRALTPVKHGLSRGCQP